MNLLEPRAEPSRTLQWAAPPIAIGLMLISGSILFLLLGRDPLQAAYVFFIQPLESGYGWSELLLKAGPLHLTPKRSISPAA